VIAAEWTMAAEPVPASLLKAARRKPWIRTPTKPPAPASQEKAERTMVARPGMIESAWLHQGHQRRRDLSDALDPADDHQADQHREEQAEEDRPLGVGENRQDRVGGDLRVGLIGLEHIAAAEAPADAHQGEDHGQDLSEPAQADLGQPVAQVVHGAAGDVSVRALDAVLLAQRALGELGAHAQEARDHHPEHGAGAAEAHCDRHSGDVPESHRG
jgi:hypothetical protein